MFESWQPHTRRIFSSLAYTALVGIVAGLGYLTFRGLNEQRLGPERGRDTNDTESIPLVEYDSFSSRRERTTDSERLSVSLKLRLTAPGELNCYVFVLARNDHVTPKLWGVWPKQGPDGAVTSGGHFQPANPGAGFGVSLKPSWTRVTATVDHPLGQAAYDMVTVYVVSDKGQIVLARPFALS